MSMKEHRNCCYIVRTGRMMRESMDHVLQLVLEEAVLKKWLDIVDVSFII